MQVGLGPHEFDCSGFYNTVLAGVLGKNVQDLPRHVRELYDKFADGLDSKVASNDSVWNHFLVGNSLVLGRKYMCEDGYHMYPAHIGIITRISTDRLTLLHAKSSEGHVVKSHLTRQSPDRLGKILGVIPLQTVVEKMSWHS